MRPSPIIAARRFTNTHIGGTIETQKNFLEALAHDSSQRRRPAERPGTKKPPIANRFALGYTYQDVLETDQDDVLARLSEYLLVECSPAFTSLLPPLFTQKSVPDFALTILLDWAEPWKWLRQLRNWVRAIRVVMDAADDNVRDTMEENIQHWRQRRKGPKQDTSSLDHDPSLPINLGPGEWDEPLGVPVCVVCQNAEKIEILEREHGWKDEEFDTVLIYLRTVLLKHGGSLIYTASAAPGSLQKLTRSMLDIHSLLQRDPLKHNVNDRDKVLVPPNWDSWGKIRPLREDVDFEAISNGWSLDIQAPRHSVGEHKDNNNDMADESPEASAVHAYEALIKDPTITSTSPRADATTENESLHCPTNQEFFTHQLPLLEKYKVDDEAEAKAKRLKDSRKAPNTTSSTNLTAQMGALRGGDEGRVAEHIGPVQFNMGGIQVDADQMLQRIKNREMGREKEREETTERAGSPFVQSPGAEREDGEPSNEHLRSFFASLASKGGSSTTNSPRAEGK